MPNLFNNIKSFVVDEEVPPTGCVWLYDDHCLSGSKVEVCSDVPELGDAKYNFASKTSSFKFGPGVNNITIFTDKNYEGSYSTIAGDRYGSDGVWFNKAIEALKISKA